MKRRPTAADREIADYVRAMRPGDWTVYVENLMEGEGFGFAPFKPEGGMMWSDTYKRITFIPPWGGK